MMQSQQANLGADIAKSLQGDQALKVVYRTAGFGEYSQMHCNLLCVLIVYQSGLVGGLSGAAIAAYRYIPAIPAAFYSSIRTGTSAFIFFCAPMNLVLIIAALSRVAQLSANTLLSPQSSTSSVPVPSRSLLRHGSTTHSRALQLVS